MPGMVGWSRVALAVQQLRLPARGMQYDHMVGTLPGCYRLFNAAYPRSRLDMTVLGYIANSSAAILKDPQKLISIYIKLCCAAAAIADSWHAVQPPGRDSTSEPNTPVNGVVSENRLWSH